MPPLPTGSGGRTSRARTARLREHETGGPGLVVRAGTLAGRVHGVAMRAGLSRYSRALSSGMKISAAARVSGVSPRSLRHYEDEGLIVPGRLGNGFRDYCQSTLDRVLVVRSLLESGLPVRLIRQLLPRLADGSDAGTDAVRAEFLHEVQSYRDRLAARIAILNDRQAALDAYLREAAGNDRCPPLDVDVSVRILRSAHGDRRAAEPH